MKVLYRSRVKITEKEIITELSPYFMKGYPIWLPKEGWWDLIMDTHKAILAVSPEYKITQIKEKFGALSYYIDGVDYYSVSGKETHKIIRHAESISTSICFICGREGSLWSSYGWTYTLCKYHKFKEWKRYWKHRQKYKILKILKRERKNDFYNLF